MDIVTIIGNLMKIKSDDRKCLNMAFVIATENIIFLSGSSATLQ